MIVDEPLTRKSLLTLGILSMPGAVCFVSKSSNSEIPRLNPVGQTVLGGISSFLINGMIHPISTIQSRMMASPSSTLKTSLQGMSFFNLYGGFWSIFLTDALAFSVAYWVDDALKKRVSPLAASVAAGLCCAPAMCVGEGFARNRQVHEMPYSTIFERAIRPAGLA